MLTRKFVIAAIAAVLAGSSAASATVFTDTESFGPASTNWGTSTSFPSYTPTQAINFAGFNSALGTLTSVTISVSEAASGTVNLTNQGSTTTTADAFLTNKFKFALPSTTVNTLTDDTSDYAATLAGGASSGPQPVSGTVAATPFTYTDPTDLAFYSTAWSALAGDLGSVSVSSGNGNGVAAYTDTGLATISINYTYTPTSTVTTPEPASLALLGVSLAGIGLLRRRGGKV